MPDPLIKWAKRNTHSDPPLFPCGLKTLTRPLLSLLPPVEELWDAGVKKSVMVVRFDLDGVLGVSWLWVSSGLSEEKVACFSTICCSEMSH